VTLNCTSSLGQPIPQSIPVSTQHVGRRSHVITVGVAGTRHAHNGTDCPLLRHGVLRQVTSAPQRMPRTVNCYELQVALVLHRTKLTAWVAQSLWWLRDDHHCGDYVTTITVVITWRPSLWWLRDEHHCGDYVTTITVVITWRPSLWWLRDDHHCGDYVTNITVVITWRPSLWWLRDDQGQVQYPARAEVFLFSASYLVDRVRQTGTWT